MNPPKVVTITLTNPQAELVHKAMYELTRTTSTHGVPTDAPWLSQIRERAEGADCPLHLDEDQVQELLKITHPSGMRGIVVGGRSEFSSREVSTAKAIQRRVVKVTLAAGWNADLTSGGIAIVSRPSDGNVPSSRKQEAAMPAKSKDKTVEEAEAKPAKASRKLRKYPSTLPVSTYEAPLPEWFRIDGTTPRAEAEWILEEGAEAHADNIGAVIVLGNTWLGYSKNHGFYPIGHMLEERGRRNYILATWADLFQMYAIADANARGNDYFGEVEEVPEPVKSGAIRVRVKIREALANLAKAGTSFPDLPDFSPTKADAEDAE